MAAMAVLSTRFGLRMADFILSRIRSLSTAKPSHFYQGLAELKFIKAVQPQWSGRTGFPKQVSEPGASWTWPWQTRAVARARSVIFRRASRNNCPGDGQSCKAVAAVSRPIHIVPHKEFINGQAKAGRMEIYQGGQPQLLLCQSR